MRRARIVEILLKVNIARRISDHLLGDEHPIRHRMIVGFCLMIVGGGIANIATGYMVLHFLSDIIGYGIHGAGTIPFIDWLTKKKMEERPHIARATSEHLIHKEEAI